ncbi:MAG: exo-alpha-sialidase [Armatimonadetes bacterium]|nr:exo-alpha-sialidase [Armatimonadota bacterium]
MAALLCGAVGAQSARRMQVVRVPLPRNAKAIAPRVAPGPNNKIYATWAQRNGSGFDVMVSCTLADGESWSKPLRVSDERGAAWAGHGEGPSLVVDRLGYVYLSWTDGRKGKSVLFSRSGADVAENMTKPVRVSDADASQCFQSLAVDERGTIFVSWLDERSGTPAIYLASSKDGARFDAVEASRGFPGVPCDCCRTSLSADGGRLWLAFRNNVNNLRDVYVAWSDDGARTFNYPTEVSPDRWKTASCPMSGPAVAVASKGQPLVFWWTASSLMGAPQLLLARSNDGGRGFGRPLTAMRPSATNNHPALAARGLDVVMAWEDTVGGRPVVRAQASDDGGLSFYPLKLGKDGETAVGRFPAVALDAAGKPIVAWNNEDETEILVAFPPRD